jgi:hypothetical protein
VAALPEAEALRAAACDTALTFHEAEEATEEIEETDLLFIDTRHVYEQLRAELRRHSGRVRQYVVLHGTTAFADYGEEPGHRGLWPAVEEFLAQGDFRLRQRYMSSSGLTVLERA